MDWRERCVEQGQFEPGAAEQVSDFNEYTFGALFLERSSNQRAGAGQ
jgi:hypothetical protein